MPAGGEFRPEVEAAVPEREGVAGADDVTDRPDGLPIRHFDDRHAGLAGEQFDEQALAVGRQVLDEDVGHAGSAGHA